MCVFVVVLFINQFILYYIRREKKIIKYILTHTRTFSVLFQPMGLGIFFLVFGFFALVPSVVVEGGREQ